MEKFVVTGNVVFVDGLPQRSCRAFVRVLDTSYADVPSRVVAEQVVVVAAGQSFIFFELMAELDVRNDLCLYVHVDVDGDGKVSGGDYITMQAYPIVANKKMDVEVKRV